MAPSSQAARGVRVLTIDDQELFRRVAREVIEATPEFESVGDADSGEAGLEAVARLAPDLVLCDVRMPGMTGFDVARQLAATHADTVVVLVSIDAELDAPAEAAPVLRKQDFGPRLLRQVWDERGR